MQRRNAQVTISETDLEKLKSLTPERSFFSKAAQAAFFTIGFGVVVIYIKSSQNCVEDMACIDQILRKLPKEYSTATLIVCGGVEFGITSGICAMEAIPAFLKHVKQYDGIGKFIRGGGVLLAAGIATIETFLVAMKAFDTPKEAFASPNVWISMVSAYPMNLYGAVNILSKDIPRLISGVNQKRGLYQGKPQDARYELLQRKYKEFLKTTSAKWTAMIPQAKTIDISDTKQNPLKFLYEAKLEVKPQPMSALTLAGKSILGTIGMVSSVGVIAPVATNTYRVLCDTFLDDHSSTELIILMMVLSATIGLARDRAVIGKTVSGSMELIDWSPSYDLRLQLNPKITIAAILLGIPTAYFSYPVIKMLALANFEEPYREPIAEIGGYSVEYSHLVFSLKLLSLLLMRLGSHYLYRVQEKVEQVLTWTLEEFDEFVKGLQSDEQHLYLGIEPDSGEAELLKSVKAEEESEEKELSRPESEHMKEELTEPLLPDDPESGEPKGVTPKPRQQSFAKRLCCWWRSSSDESRQIQEDTAHLERERLVSL